MKIINAMFGKGLGGIEQAFLDYNHALSIQNISVHPFIHPKAKVRKYIEIPYHKISNFSKFDPFAILKLRKAFNQINPNFILAHGNRAISLCAAASKLTPVIAVCHNSKLQYDARVKHIFAVAEHLIPMLIKVGYERSQITVIPNMAHIPDDLVVLPIPKTDILKVGTISRLSHEKGLDSFISSIAELKNRNVKVKAYIAGEGSELKDLQKLAHDLHVEDSLEFMGWVENKHEFFDKIDIFCLPSKIETFGIVLLEAMAESKFIVSTKTAGGNEVLEGGKLGLLASINDPIDLANKMQEVFQDFEKFDVMRKYAVHSISKYSTLNVSRQIARTLEKLSYQGLKF